MVIVDLELISDCDDYYEFPITIIIKCQYLYSFNIAQFHCYSSINFTIIAIIHRKVYY